MISMTKKTILRSLLVLSAALVPSVCIAMDATEIVRRSLDATYYAGTDMRIKVTMQLVNPKGDIREREMTMLRLNLPGGEQRYYTYFHRPVDVKGTAFLVQKFPEKEDDRWIFVPAIKLVKRIASNDKRSSFVGSDFTYEDVSGREVADETHVLLGEETVDNRTVYRIESKPTTPIDYSRRVSLIDKERLLPLKEDYYDLRDRPSRVFSATKVENVANIWTITARTMKNLQTGYRTDVTYQDIHYNSGLEPDIFTERYLRNPPQQWVK
jgi:outer membrane lipoprotein-sorting protein